jgi:thiamine biosynthesis lipoprotein
MYRTSVEPVLGTRLTMRVECAESEVAIRAEARALAVADRLEAILSAYRPNSPFNEWRRGLLPDPPLEVAAVLELALAWHRRTGGAFNCCLGDVVRRWRRAEAEQRLPDPQELADLVRAARSPPFTVEGDAVVTTGDCAAVDVHGIAKGWVVDRMVEAVLDDDAVVSVLVDLGGDIRHGSAGGGAPATIAVENPFTVADNAPPLTTVRLSDQAIATSGGGRRGWRIEGRWYGHLLDPTTGWPVPHQRSCSVVAPTTAEADAAASALAVLDAAPAASMATRLGSTVLTVDSSGRAWRSASWQNVVDETSMDRDPDQPDRDDR